MEPRFCAACEGKGLCINNVSLCSSLDPSPFPKHPCPGAAVAGLFLSARKVLRGEDYVKQFFTVYF